MLSKDETAILQRLTSKLLTYLPKNLRNEAVYEGKNRVKRLRDSGAMHDNLADLETALSWGNIVVESVVENVKLEGFRNPSGNPKIDELIKVFKKNHYTTKAKQDQRECGIYGTSYILTGYGDVEAGENEFLITNESSKNCVGEVNPRTGRLNNFMKIVEGGGVNGEDVGFLYLPGVTIYFEIKGVDANSVNLGTNVSSFAFKEISREVHGNKFIPASKHVNRGRPSKPGGQSEITRSIRDHCIIGSQTFTNLRVATEIFATPQRYFLGVDTKTWGEAGGIEGYMNKLWAIGNNKDGKTPVAGQFNPSSPEPLLKVIKESSLQIVAETGIPESYFGIQSPQPPSADAMRVGWERQNRRSLDRQQDAEPFHIDVLRNLSLLKYGEVVDGIEDVEIVWASTYPSTPAADADANSKNIAAGVYGPESPTAQRLAGVKTWEVEANKVAAAKAVGTNVLSSIKAAAEVARANPIVNATAESNSESV